MVLEVVCRCVSAIEARVWVGVRDGDICGWVFAKKQSKQQVGLFHLCVEPTVRRLGTGSALINTAIAHYMSGFGTLVSEVGEGMQTAQKFFLAKGFTQGGGTSAERHYSLDLKKIGEAVTATP